MGGHMMWYKDQHRGMPLRDGGHQHPGAEGGFYMGGGATGMAGGDHAASSARLQQQVSYLLAENHNLRMVIRSMSQEREEFSRKSEGLFSFVSLDFSTHYFVFFWIFHALVKFFFPLPPAPFHARVP
jgi:hypothetical protein